MSVSIEETGATILLRVQKPCLALTHLPKRPPIDVEFRNLTYTVPIGKKGNKSILKNISGQFKSGQLHAILGPSGAGKSSLLNILAGYKLTNYSGDVLVNSEIRNMKNFSRISRYIMQEDLLQPLLSVQEIMELASELKLSRELCKADRELAISEILQLLRLTKTKDTRTQQLSGGEKKRLSIALELLNNPPVLFLDEPTTGLDDLASAQCISLLKQLAKGGRTIICSIHTPSAKIFSTFDNVYVLADGYCNYQGYGPDIVPFLSNIGLSCPKSYNPADFIIEVCSGEYGNFSKELLSASKNGNNFTYYKTNIIKVAKVANVSTGSPNSALLLRNSAEAKTKAAYSATTEVLTQQDLYECPYDYDCSSWMQFRILLRRMMIQMCRDRTYLLLRTVLIFFIGLVIGGVFFGMGYDGSKALFNFGFFYTCVIKFLYIPMMPVLSWFPSEIQLIKREHFNRWYGLKPYFTALTISTLPMTFILGAIYCAAVYIMTNQPMELDRILLFYIICMFTALVSESMGLIISSHMNPTNSNFLGPVAAVPLMLLAVYGMGFGPNIEIPILIQAAMRLDFMRYAIHGLVTNALTGRGTLECPPEELVCKFADMDNFLKFLKMDGGSYWVDIGALITMYVVFRVIAFHLLKQRLGKMVWWKRIVMGLLGRREKL